MMRGQPSLLPPNIFPRTAPVLAELGQVVGSMARVDVGIMKSSHAWPAPRLVGDGPCCSCSYAVSIRSVSGVNASTHSLCVHWSISQLAPDSLHSDAVDPLFSPRRLGLPAVSLSVCLFVTSRYSIETAERRITQTTPHDGPGTLVFRCQRSRRNSNAVTPTGV